MGNYLQAPRLLEMGHDKAKCHKAQVQMSMCSAAYTPVLANLWVMLMRLGEQQQLQRPQCSLNLLAGLELCHTLLILGVPPSCVHFVRFGQARQALVHTKGSWALPLGGLHNTQ